MPCMSTYTLKRLRDIRADLLATVIRCRRIDAINGYRETARWPRDYFAADVLAVKYARDAADDAR